MTKPKNVIYTRDSDGEPCWDIPTGPDMFRLYRAGSRFVNEETRTDFRSISAAAEFAWQRPDYADLIVITAALLLAVGETAYPDSPRPRTMDALSTAAYYTMENPTPRFQKGSLDDLVVMLWEWVQS